MPERQAPVRAPAQAEHGKTAAQPRGGASLGNGDRAALLESGQRAALHRALVDHLDHEMGVERTLLLPGRRYEEGGADPRHPEHQGILAMLDRDHDGDVDEDDAVLLWAEEGSAPEEVGFGDSLSRFAQQIEREVGRYGPEMWRFAQHDRMEELVTAMGEAPLTLRVHSGMAPTNPEEWSGPGGRFDDHQSATRGSYEADMAREMSRPYRANDVFVAPRGLAAAIQQASRHAYAITVAVDECETQDIPFVQRALFTHEPQVARITVRGVEVSYHEFEQIYERFAWEENHAYARDPRTGMTYDTSSPEGRLARDQHAREERGIDHSNPLVESGGMRRLDSTMGLMSPDQIRAARDHVRAHPDDPTALARLGHAQNAERDTVSSQDGRFDGKTVPEVARLVFGEAAQLLEIANRAIQEQGTHLEAATRLLSQILDAEVKHDNFEALAGRLTYLREEIETKTGTVITPYGLTAEAAQKRAVLRMGDVRALDGTFVATAGGVVDALVPDVGDKGKLQLNVNVPVGGGVGKVGFGMAIDLERDPRGVKMRLQLEGKLIGTVDLSIAEAFLEARLFGYMETYGDHGAELFHLLMLGIEHRLRRASDDLADELFGAGGGYTMDVRDGMDGDDYVEYGLGASLTAGITQSVGGDRKTDSLGRTVTTGTRLRRGSDEEPFEQLDTVSDGFGITFNAGPFEISGKLASKRVDGRLSQIEIELAGKHDCAIDELSESLQDAHFVSGIVSEMTAMASEGSGLLGSDTARGISSLSELGALATGRQLAAANQLQQFGRQLPNFHSLKIGHQLAVKATWTPDSRWALEICLERLATIQFGENARDLVYVALENIDPVLTLRLP